MVTFQEQSPDPNVVMKAFKNGMWRSVKLVKPPNKLENNFNDSDKVYVHYCGLSDLDDEWLEFDRYIIYFT
jgi:hypothetical protein